MRYFFFLPLILGSAVAFAFNSPSGSYRLLSDTCFENQQPKVCNPLYRTSLQEMDLAWSVGANPLAGSLWLMAKQMTPSYYADDLVPVGQFSNFSSAATNNLVYVYRDTAWVNKPVFATPGYCKIQMQFHPVPQGLVVRILGIKTGKCDSGTFTEIVREMTFQRE